jgi:hypothetical protein
MLGTTQLCPFANHQLLIMDCPGLFLVGYTTL